MPSFHITEPHPSVSSPYIYSGRGGAGNLHRAPASVTNGATATGPASLVKIPPPSSSTYFTSGRGGAGNMRREQERAMFSFDEELQQQERLRSQQAPVYHVGRGGAGNAVLDGEGSGKSGRQGSTSSVESVQSEGVRRSLEGVWGKIRRASHQ